ncbi:hypothetical protein A5755_31345 [Mycolicibacterium fortuitum]|nr:hypothetical protein A5763_07995 [Mycolicibacterium fortuitum]OBB51890.1 hypothetical protein A5754_23400 [Mycolicibacterium fortuitum]OBB54023.1 hypothetical protein A5755_31345 [Mycolicibacterium fortuitum]OBF86910.1 hypothetical protein A5751_08010 [Mycolicibacterium fortuitum]OBG18108.1 hypothetical protein A5768_03255 [Mycolicibacterium fortuitum]
MVRWGPRGPHSPINADRHGGWPTRAFLSERLRQRQRLRRHGERNVVAIGIVERAGHPISFWPFAGCGIVVTALSAPLWPAKPHF